MKRRYRLTDKERFRQVRQTGISHVHSLLVLCVLPNDQAFSRCGFTVSRRIGKAVERNRERRRMSEAVRLSWDLVRPGWDLVWIARPAIHAAEFSAVQEACIQLLGRAHLLCTVTEGAEDNRPDPRAAGEKRANPGLSPATGGEG